MGCVPKGHRQQHTSCFPSSPVGTVPALRQGALPKRHAKLVGVGVLEVPGRVYIPTLTQCLAKPHTLSHLNLSHQLLYLVP